VSIHAKESPGALAGATGVDDIAHVYKSKQYRMRAATATALAQAIADCDPADACTIMAAAYDDLRAGQPIVPFGGLMLEAKNWAEFATRCELKAYGAASFANLQVADRSAFLEWAHRLHQAPSNPKQPAAT
jgi:hypothetical protein